MPKTDPASALADAALKLLAKKSWSELTLAEVAKAAKLPMTQLQSLTPAKPALMGVILRRIGSETTARYKPEKGSASVRDRIFDVMMTWFEVLGSRKPAARSLYEGLGRDPLSLLAAREEIVAAASWLLALAQADTGPMIPLRALGLAGVMARAIPIWLDDGKDMAKTMARLDGDLSRIENLLRRTG
jgi:AcrR family transcriptional regulator